jgi:hypothetical protein
MNKGLKDLLSKIVCINLEYNKEKLDIISFKYNIDLEYMLSLKEKNIKKVWIKLGDDSNYLVATLRKSNKVEFVSGFPDDRFREEVKKIKPVDVPEVPMIDCVTSSSVKEFDVDTILDKISESGVASITKEELDFLKKI